MHPASEVKKEILVNCEYTLIDRGDDACLRGMPFPCWSAVLSQHRKGEMRLQWHYADALQLHLRRQTVGEAMTPWITTPSRRHKRRKRLKQLAWYLFAAFLLVFGVIAYQLHEQGYDREVKCIELSDKKRQGLLTLKEIRYMREHCDLGH